MVVKYVVLAICLNEKQLLGFQIKIHVIKLSCKLYLDRHADRNANHQA